MRTFLVLTMAAYLVPGFGQQVKRTPPPPGAPRPFQFPKYETRKLANGLTVFVIEDHREPMVTYQLTIATAGASATDPSLAGLATITAGLLRKGTQNRTAQQIAKTIDLSGGSLAINSGFDTVASECSMMKSNADLGLDLLADVIINPTFPQNEVERLMRQTFSAIAVSFHDPDSLAEYLARRLVYGTHPYAMPAGGTPDTLRKLKREDIVLFHRAQYAPAHAYLAISGDVTPAEAFAKAEKYFGNWKGSVEPPAAAAPPAPATRHIVILDKPDAVQTQYRILEVAIPRNDPDYIPLQVANQIFGGSFHSRLNMKLRANEGLTYGARSALETQRQTGIFVARSSSRTDKTVTAIKMMADLLADYREHPVTEAELQQAKAYLAGSFALSVEEPEAVAQHVLIVAINGLASDYWETYRDKVLATTAEQVTAAVRRHLTPDKMDIVAVGNASQFSKDLETLGTVEVIPLAEFDLTSPNLRRASEPGTAGTH